MHKHYIKNIIEHGTPDQMEEMKDVFEDLICEIKDIDEKLYLDTELKLHKILYSHHLGETIAKEWVDSMKNKDGTVGAHWAKEQTELARKQYAPNIDADDFFAAINMLYSDYYRADFSDKDYIQLAIDWFNDIDAGEDKLLNYYYYIVR